MLILLGASFVSGQGKYLDIKLKGQLKSNWCWAACTQMIDSFYNQRIRSQCDIVDSYFEPLEGKSIIIECDTLACNEPVDFSLPHYNEALSYFDIYQGFSRVLSNLGYYSSLEYYPNNKAWETITKEIDNCRPMILFIAQGTSNNITVPNENKPTHALVIYGYRIQGDMKYLMIRDPWYPFDNRCGKCNFSEINFTNVQSINNCVITLSGYQMNICLRNESFCSPCNSAKTPIPFNSDTSLVSRSLEDEPIIIQVKILDINSKLKGNNFLTNELFDKYYPNSGNTIGYEVFNKQPLEIEIKYCSYPSIINATFRGESIKISYDGKNNTPKYTAIYAPYPYGMKYYSFSSPNSQEIFYVSDQIVYDPLNPKKILFNAYEVYSEKAFNNRIDCYSKKLFKTPALLIESRILEFKNKLNRVSLNNSKI